MANLSTANGLTNVIAQVKPWGQKTLPSSLSVPAVIFIGLSATALFLGLEVAVGKLPVRAGIHHPTLSTGAVVLVCIVAVVGRLLGIAIQAQASVALGGRGWRSRSRRQDLFLIVLLCQLPLALRDWLVGLAGMTGLLSFGSLANLEESIFDPFAWWSCILFAVFVNSIFSAIGKSSRMGLIVGFSGYAFAVKIAFVAFTLSSIR